ncbi:hypothetical protein SDC9_48803 [bioreactor metagenome]|uniref:Lipoprotein n=1 Tax=bioreactor metagenome TaxID=1076179 RepID=A0A644WJY3_9ZZZZ
MKIKSIRNIFALALILFTVYSCTGFEDGPKISFRSTGKKLCSTKWKIETATKNNTDITADVLSHFNFRLFFGGAKDTYGGTIITELIIYNTDDNGGAGFGDWNFATNDVYSSNYDDSKIDVQLLSFSGDTNTYYPFVKTQFIRYSIQRLTMKELWLQHTDSIGTEFFIKFKNS